MPGFNWKREGDGTAVGLWRLQMPTVQATVTLVPPPVVVDQKVIMANLPTALVELTIRIKGPAVSLYSDNVVWCLRCSVEIAVLNDDPCMSCHGQGRYVALPGDEIADCPYCLGSGFDLVGKGQEVADALLAGMIVQRVIERRW